MVGPIALTTLMGAITYVWLTIVGHPLWRGLRATLDAADGAWLPGSDPYRRITRSAPDGVVGWAAGLPLATAMAVLAAAIPTAACALIAMAYPATATALPELAGVPLGLVAGLSIWMARAAIFGLPRAAPDIEMALALAVVVLKNDDPRMLSRVGEQYEHFILTDRQRRAHGIEHAGAV